MTDHAGISPRDMVVRMLLLVSAYFIAGRLGLLLPFFGSNITLIWLPTGIAVAALLRWGKVYWPAIFVGAFTTNLAIGSPPLLAASIALGNTLGPLLAAYLLRKLAFHSEFNHARDILLLVISAAIGMTVSASGGVASLALFSMLQPADMVMAWLSWWAGDFTGVLLAAPLLLNLSRAELEKFRAQRMEFPVWCLIMLAAGWGVFFPGNSFGGHSLPLVFTILPLVVWSAMRFGVAGSSLGILLPVTIAAWATSTGIGPFRTQDIHHSLLLLWTFQATLVLLGLMVAALQAGRKRAEDELRSSDANLRAILDNFPYMAWLKDTAGRYVLVNKVYLEYFRLKDMSQVIGKTDLDFQQKELAEIYRSNDIDVMTSRQQKYFEDPSFDGKETHWTETFKTPVIDKNGEVLGTAGFARDISERKQAEAELQHNRDLLNEAQRLGQLGSWELDMVSGVLRWTDEVYRIFELDPAQFSPSYENFLNVIHPDDRDKVNRAYTQSLENHQPYDIEHRLLLADGRIKWVREHCSSEFDASGKPLRSVGAVQDVTGQHLVAEQLRIAATTFETQEAICITDPQANILRVNHAFEVLSGYSAEEMLGKNPRILQSGRHDAAFYQLMWSELLNAGKWSGEIWDRRKNGEIYPKWMTITAVCDDQHRVTHFVAVSADISQRKQSEQEIHQLAFFDPLTKLPNRRLLLDRLQQAMAVGLRSGRYGALLFLDLDHFKTVNDTQGHAVGDLLLLEVARRLQACVREGDSVARLGGDEFVVVLEELSRQRDDAAAQAELVAEKIRNELNQPYMLGDYECHSTPSIGIRMFRGHLDSVEDLLKHADVAMYQVKAAGRNAIRFFDPQMQTNLDMRIALETDLHRALVGQQFRLYYQVQVDGRGKATGAEALLRWEHPERGLVSPAEFIPLAEETGLIVPIGLWVLQIACTQLKAWQQNVQTCNLTLAVNVSAKQFRQADFVTQVQRTLLESGARPAQLKLELTESTVLENVEDTIARMRELKLLGISFSMDDFGTGYSSLQYLKRLPLDQIKIDQSFVRDITSDPNDAAIVQAIIAMTEALGLNVIAEGVETVEQEQFLKLRGCHVYQGYLFGKPLPLESFVDRLKQEPL